MESGACRKSRAGERMRVRAMRKVLLCLFMVGSLNASELKEISQFVELPSDLQGYLIPFFGEGCTIKQAVKKVLCLRQVCKLFNGMLANPRLLYALLQRSSVESTDTSLALHGGFQIGPSTLFLAGVNQQKQLFARIVKASTLDFAMVPVSVLEFVEQQYTEAEKDALRRYIALHLAENAPHERTYMEGLLERIYSKGQLIDFIQQEMLTFYDLQPISVAGFFERTYGFRSLEERSPESELVLRRFERFKLAVPFFIEMCSRGFVTQDLRELLRIGIQDFGRLLEEQPDREELAELCGELTKAIFVLRGNERWEEVMIELREPPQKRVKSAPLIDY